MIKQFISLILTTVILNLSLAVVVPAQTQTDKDAQQRRDVEIFVNRFGADNRLPVKVVLKNDKKPVVGFISKINDETFVVTGEKTKVVTTIEYSNVKKINRETHHRLLIGSLVVIGALFAAVFICQAAGGCVE